MLPIAEFTIARLPRIVFGEGVAATLPQEARAFGRRALIVTGAGSFRRSEHWPLLEQGLADQGMDWAALAVEDEPSPELVDRAVAEHRDGGIELVIGIGGGSALDAAKAIAGLLPHGNSVMDHLEGVGRGVAYRGPALPFIAVPTTAGTGSEATRNAVLSRRGADGFKKSFRHDALVAQVAIVDPALIATCPRDVLAANGMDAFTQLLEGYVSARANPLTDALALSGIAAFAEGFPAVWAGGEGAAAGRSGLAYASLLSGIVLAQAGLGSVHGLASPLGALFPIPHGTVCGTLVAEATDINIRALRARQPDHPSLAKYARVGALLLGRPEAPAAEALAHLVERLRGWLDTLDLPRLSVYGLTADRIALVAAQSRGGSMATNPIVLTDDELAELLARRL